MPTNILMPALSPTMTEGTLATWHKNEGDKVEIGDVIAEIETDKATMEVEAADEGVMGKILVSAGTEGVPVNEPIAILLEEGEDASALDQAPDPSGGAKAQSPQSEGGNGKPEESGAADSNAGGSSGETPPPRNNAGADPGGKAPPAPKTSEGKRVLSSPLARRIAEGAGIDLTALKGSGPGGRIVRADVEQAIERGTAAKPRPETAPAEAEKAPASAQAGPKAAGTGPDPRQLATAYGIPFTEQKVSQMRKVIARRLTESKQTVPHFYLTVDCQLDALLKLRKELNAQGEEAGIKLSVNDLIIKAVAAGLKKVPAANAAWAEDAILLYDRADISVAVATESGLITPIIKDAGSKGLGTISSEMKDLAKRARDNKLKPEEFQGGTFSISNLGMYGISDFAAIINPPQGCILAVGKGEQRPVVKDGALAVATVMTCTLSVDHRVVDGAIGAEFLQAFQALVENPLGLML
ncbi:pyruvate dehydrogenase complex dihydrolipoamide acetyltransferase [Fodinicurvata sp. EGI_FJ10296]|uniref:pyruvate dehydrogenase complex dihydrolipoamide acetyltransferase n=1 Tax=Fodinicurvata sp. EGI_FJ10296 TaxID=3231908 RepID=UPI0034544CD7